MAQGQTAQREKGAASCKIFGSADDRSLAQPILPLDFFAGIAVGEKTWRAHGDRVNWRDMLQNKPMLTAHDVNGFALDSLLDQPAQIGLGVAEREGLGLQVEIPSACTPGNFHRLNLACVQPGVKEQRLSVLTGERARLACRVRRPRRTHGPVPVSTKMRESF